MPKNFVSYDNAEDLMGSVASHIDDRAEQKEVDDISNVYGAKNLIPYPYYTVDGVYNDITFSTDEDGRINVSGTASANTNLSLISNNDSSNWIYLQDGITYKFICSEPYDATEFNVSARAYHSDGTYQSLKPGQTYTAVEGDIVKYCTIWISKDVTIRTSTNVEVMICAASIKDDTYQPYTMTNKQLTDNARGIDIEWSDYVNLTDVQRSNNHYIIHNAPKSGIAAADIAYDNTTSELSSTNVKGAIDELAKPTFTEASSRTNIASGEKLSTILGKIKKWFSDLADMFVSKTGDTMNGNLTVNRSDGTSSDVGNSKLVLGNNIPAGTAENSRGYILMYGKSDKQVVIRDNNTNGFTANRELNIPDKSGTIALTNDIPTDFVSKADGGTFSGNIYVNRTNGTTSSVGTSYLVLGNSTASGTANNSKGVLELYGKGSNYATITATDITANRGFELPNKGGTIALTSDITANVYAKSIKVNSSGSAVKITPSTNNQTFIVFEVGSHSISAGFGVRMAIYNASETSQPFTSVTLHGSYESGNMTFSNGKINVKPVQIDSYITVISPANFTLGN